MKSPAFQFYPKQWLGDDKVMLMDWDARAMHLHFMCIAWQQDNPCTLPNDDEFLRRWVGNPKDWPRLKKQIFRAWKLENNLWIQDGLLREYEKQSKFSESRKLNAFKRWDKVERKSVDASASAVQCTADALLLQSSTTTIKNKHTDVEIPSWIDKPTWEAFVEMRKSMKAPLTAFAGKLVIAKLVTLSNDNGSGMELILQQSIANNWKGVFPLKGETYGSGNLGGAGKVVEKAGRLRIGSGLP